jgi:signal transduction histidine kinase
MRERALLVRADLDVRSGEGRGTQVRLTIPASARE